MGILAEHRVRPRFARGSRFAAIVALTVLAGWSGALPVRADTTGDISTGIPGFGLPGTPSNPPPFWGHIENEYILASVGYINTMSLPLGTSTLTLTVPGRISFGMVDGSNESSTDNNKPLVGGNGFTDVFPYGHSYFTQIAGLVGLDYPAYLRAIVDGTQYNVGYDSAKAVAAPIFRRLPEGPTLMATYTVGANDEIAIQQKIRLLRSTARLEWVITNTDTQASHNVGLRFVVNHRSVNAGFYFVDPDRGATQQITNYVGTSIPSDLSIFARRAELTPNDPVSWPFHSRHIFRGFGATEPSRVYVGDTIDLYPGETAAPVDPYLPVSNRLSFEGGIAVAAFFGGDTGFVMRPGETRTVVTYYGMGASTEIFANDVVLGTESPTSLKYNADAPNDPAVLGNTTPTLQTVAPKFLTPNPFRIYASAYNQKSSDPEFEVPFHGVRLSLTLPNGLRFAKIPGTNTVDNATKLTTLRSGGTAGEVGGDEDGRAFWWVEPTGERFGALTYQVSMTASSPTLSRTVSRTINLPSVPLVELLPGVFQMVGFPFVFDPLLSNNGDPDTVVNTLTRPEELRPAFFRWEPDPESLDGTLGRWIQETNLKTGVGYFYRPSVTTGGGTRLIFAKGVKPTPTQAPLEGVRPVPVQVRVERGWNMISNPYAYEIPLKYLRIIALENNPDLRVVPFQQGVLTGLIRAGVFFFDPTTGSYDLFTDVNQPLKPWQGYWIYMNTSAEIQFTTPTLRDSLIVPAPGGGEPPTRLVSMPKVMTAENWRLQLVATRQDGKKDAATYVGVTSDTRANTNLPKPPAFQDYVQVGLRDAQGKGRYAQVLKAPQGTKTWDLIVESDKDGEVALSWPGANSLPKRVRLSVLDLQTNARADLRSAATLRVPVRKGGVSRLRITAQTEATRRLAVAYLRSEGSRGGAYTYSLGVTQDASVDARIMTISGREVKILAAGRAAGPNGTRLTWDARNADGSPVPTGTYHLQVTVTGDDGSVVRALRPITVIR